MLTAILRMRPDLMTTQTKKYLKIVIGTLLILGKVLDPKPFWS